MTALTHAAILQTLDRVPDPCAFAMRRPISIRALGLIEHVAIVGGDVQVTLCLTDPGCVHFNALQRYITDALLGLAGVATVTVTLTTAVLWTPDRTVRDDGVAA